MANSYTPGLKLRKPAQGDDLWDDDNNANFDLLEATLGRGAGITGVIGDGLAVSDDTGLTVGYSGGSCRVNGTKYTLTGGSKVCTDNALNFVYVNISGAVTVATALPTPPYCALALAETAAGEVVRVGDLRRRIVDTLAEHGETGAHGQITPSRIEPTGTDGAYRRSPTAGYQDPEMRLNNLILKNDTVLLWNTTARGNGYTIDLLAPSLGSGYVPIDANGIIVQATAVDTSNGALSKWRFFPKGTTNSIIRDSAAVRTHYASDENNTPFSAQLAVRLNADGYFTAECITSGPATAGCSLRLVGWTEPA